MALSTEEWVDVGGVFKDSLDHVMQNSKALDQKAQERIMMFVHSTAIADKPWMLCTQLGIKRAVEVVFEDVVLRDFILQLSFTFFSRWGASGEKYAHLIETLAFAVSVNGHDAPNGTLLVPSAIPPAVADDMVTQQVALSALHANKWLVIMLLISLVVQLPEEVTHSRRTRPTQAHVA
jgi:hypothetical protein